ncbi:MAG TPA: hypothetical protein VN702_17830 [Acetobacteraceae bacterium]|nr:hypothetical protein [Acetobacteraceae bacterium]
MNTILAPHHRMPAGYDAPDETGPDVARLNKLRAELRAAVCSEMRRARRYTEDELADWLGALDDMPDLETAMQNDREAE